MSNDIDQIIEDALYDLNTPSLQELGNEPIPGEIIRDLLNVQWTDGTPVPPRPQIVVKNDTKLPPQGDLRHDWILIDAPMINESQRGFKYDFKDITVPVTIEIRTMQGRQRLYNLMREVRRIIYRFMRALKPYQQMYWDDFTDYSQGLSKNWMGECHIRCTSLGVPTFKGVTEGMGSANLPPDQR